MEKGNQSNRAIENILDRPWMARQQGYNKVGADYEGARYGSRIGRSYLRRRSETLMSAIDEHFPDKKRLSILELGCGPGTTVEFLCDQTDHQIFAIDFSRTFLGRVEARTAKLSNRPSLMLANAMELPFEDNIFDVICATRFVHQFPHEDKIRLARECCRVLRPGGVAILEFYARPFNYLNYYLHIGDADIYSTLEEHLSHYPSRREVRDIVGGEYCIKGLRFLADRYINRILGYRGFALFNKCLAAVPPLRWLMNEHWIIYSPKQLEDGNSPPAAREILSTPEIIRCPKCLTRLTRDREISLNCKACNLAYPIVDGIPNLLSHEAQSLP